jgi:acyl-CoA synthetase (AMP-forming)/AMP-acid ligase II
MVVVRMIVPKDRWVRFAERRWPMPTIGGIVIQNARRVPNRDALVAGDRRWSWRALDDEVGRIAAVLEDSGCSPWRPRRGDCCQLPGVRHHGFRDAASRRDRGPGEHPAGRSEAGPTGLYSTMEHVRSNPSSSGHLAQPFVEARLITSSGADARVGEVGELQLRGEPVMKGYWRRPEASAETVRDGWLRTGDLFERAPDGSMRLVDRIKDVIISGGRNIYSAEVEAAVRRHPDVADCAVIGRDEPDWGETVVVVVTPVNGAEPTLDDIREFCAPLIADYKLPRVLVIGDIPRNAAGKIQKHLLRMHPSGVA